MHCHSTIRALLLSCALVPVISKSLDIAARQTVPSSQCISGVHIIVARGTTEARGEGSMRYVAQKIVEKVPDSNSHGLPYPASFSPTYQKSERSGVHNLTKYIEEYVQSCPDARIVLLGYSQGAQVVGNVLCGTSEEGFPHTPPLPMEYGKHIKAVVWFGDPTHVKGLPWDFGTSHRNGIFPRMNNTACDPYASHLRSYCDHRDEFCDSGTSLAVHLEYVSKYGDAAADFVVSKVT